MGHSFSGALQERIGRLAAADDYDHYRAVRDWVLRLKDWQAGDGVNGTRPSLYWLEEIAGFEYMFDATPLIVEKLRHHCYHITGLKVYDYRSEKNAAKAQFAEKIAALNALGHADLLVPESPRLGGFGHLVDGALYNIDTLKFYEALLALERGGVLGAFRNAQDRLVVWEIGAGWGGFAYSFKTLFPNVTYVIVDLPETMLFSGTYLRSLFPRAEMLFYEPGMQLDEAAWRHKDFILLPHFALEEFRPHRLDLTVNMVSFQEMTTDQVRVYVHKAADLGSRFIYSLNRDRSHYNAELSSVPALLQERFWMREIPVLPVPYTRMLPSGEKDARSQVKRLAKAARLGLDRGEKAGRGSDYQNLVGWPRIAS